MRAAKGINNDSIRKDIYLDEPDDNPRKVSAVIKTAVRVSCGMCVCVRACLCKHPYDATQTFSFLPKREPCTRCTRRHARTHAHIRAHARTRVPSKRLTYERHANAAEHAVDATSQLVVRGVVSPNVSPVAEARRYVDSRDLTLAQEKIPEIPRAIGSKNKTPVLGVIGEYAEPLEPLDGFVKHDWKGVGLVHSVLADARPACPGMSANITRSAVGTTETRALLWRREHPEST